MSRRDERGGRSGRRVPRTVPRERSARWLAQREHLLQAAQRAIHRDGPQLSMDDLAAEAGITKPILYRHFGDRRGLARALRDASFGLLLGVNQDDSATTRQAARERVAALYPIVGDRDELRRVVVTFAVGFQTFAELNRNLFRFLRAEGVFDRMWEENEPHSPEPIAESLAGSLRTTFRDSGIDDVTAQIWAHGLRGMVAGIVDWWTQEHVCDRFELERNFDQITRALLAGLAQTLAGPEGSGPHVGAAQRRARSAPKKASVRRRRRT